MGKEAGPTPGPELEIKAPELEVPEPELTEEPVKPEVKEEDPPKEEEDFDFEAELGTNKELEDLQGLMKGIEPSKDEDEEEPKKEEEEEDEEKPKEEEEEEEESALTHKGKKKKDPAAAQLRSAYEDTKKELESTHTELENIKAENAQLKAEKEAAEKAVEDVRVRNSNVNIEEVPQVAKARNTFLEYEKRVRRLNPKMKEETFRGIVQDFHKLDDADEDYEHKLDVLRNRIVTVDPKLVDKEDFFLEKVAKAADLLSDYSHKVVAAQEDMASARLEIDQNRYSSEMNEWKALKDHLFEVPTKSAGDESHPMAVINSFRKDEGMQEFEKGVMNHMDELFAPPAPVKESEFKSRAEYLDHMEATQLLRKKKLQNVPQVYMQGLMLQPIVSVLYKTIETYKARLGGKSKQTLKVDTSKGKQKQDGEVSEYGMRMTDDGELIMPTSAEMTREILKKK